MPTTEFAADIAQPGLQPGLQSDESQIEAAPLAFGQASKLLRGLLYGFAASVTVGLALGSWYLGVRIVAGGAIGTGHSVPMVANEVANVAAKPVDESLADAYGYLAPPSQSYLGLDGLGPKRDANLVNVLQAKGFHAIIQPRAGRPNRIVIGPFSTHAAMEQAQRDLASAGVLTVENPY